MLIEMSLPLQRVRNLKKAEEGELVESDDEEEIGQLKEENGEDVAVVETAGNFLKVLFNKEILKRNIHLFL